MWKVYLKHTWMLENREKSVTLMNNLIEFNILEIVFVVMKNEGGKNLLRKLMAAESPYDIAILS